MFSFVQCVKDPYTKVELTLGQWRTLVYPSGSLSLVYPRTSRQSGSQGTGFLLQYVNQRGYFIVEEKN